MQPMDLLILLFAFVVILVGAELFTNGIEWFGHQMGLAEGAVGSVLAAVGTALPETTIPVIAILFSSGPHTSDVGIGAILGAPFMLSTLAFGVTGLVVLLVARRRSSGDLVHVDRSVMGVDLRAFVIAYAIAIGAAFLPVEPTWPKLVVAAVLLVLYGRYVRAHLTAESTIGAEGLNPLRLGFLDRGQSREEASAPKAQAAAPQLRFVIVQVLLGVGLIVLGAVAFVGAVSDIARAAGMNEVLLALIVAPIATELPEAFNAVLWVRQGKDTLAMANITGAMVFQASIATVVALAFAPAAWSFAPGTRIAFASAGIAFLSTAAIFVTVYRGGALRGRHLLIGAGFYVAYLALVAVAEAT
jgi:cation:H+ antiporter